MNVFSTSILCLLSVLSMHLYGQAVRIDSPVSRMVFQRSLANTASVPVRGTVQGQTTRVIGRLVARQNGQTTGWHEGAVQNGTFQINIPATGGLYDLEVIALAGTTELQRQNRERVGVGEVFIISGQSNNFGEAGKGLPATDERVSIVNYWPGDEGHLDEGSLPMAFSQAGPGSFCGPRNPLFIWGGVGDRLVAQLGVPVLFLGAAHPGSSTNNWREAAQGAERVSGRDWSNNIPYRPLRLALQVYGKKTGVRGILWHQGESDNNYQTTDGYVENMRILIDKTRQDSGFGDLSWMISRASYYPFYPDHERDPAIIAGQNRTIEQTANAFPGPATDDFTGPTYRQDLIHFSEYAYPFLADLWKQSLNSDYFQRARPSMPSVGPDSPPASMETPTVTATPSPSEGVVSSGAFRLEMPNYACETGVIKFRTTGGNGGEVEFMAPGITNWTTTATHQLGEGIRRDAQTLTIYARQAGEKSSMIWNLRAACDGSVPVQPTDSPSSPTQPTQPTGGALALQTPAYDCQTGTLTFQTTGGNGTAIEYMAPGLTVWTTTPTHKLGEGLQRDAETITLYARQSGVQTSLTWNLRAICASLSSARIGTIGQSAVEIRGITMPNPATEQVQLFWPGIAKYEWTSKFANGSGHEVAVTTVANEDGLLADVRHLPGGVYLWNVTSPNLPPITLRIVKLE